MSEKKKCDGKAPKSKRIRCNFRLLIGSSSKSFSADRDVKLLSFQDEAEEEETVSFKKKVISRPDRQYSRSFFMGSRN